LMMMALFTDVYFLFLQVRSLRRAVEGIFRH
jgi:hypothetical protein